MMYTKIELLQHRHNRKHSNSYVKQSTINGKNRTLVFLLRKLLNQFSHSALFEGVDSHWQLLKNLCGVG